MKKEPIEHLSRKSFLKIMSVVGLGGLFTLLFSKNASALIFGSNPYNIVSKVSFSDSSGVEKRALVDSNRRVQVRVFDSSGSAVDSFGEPIYPSGSGGAETVSLTSPSTAYAVPSTAPTSKYLLVLYNNSSNDVYWTFTNSASDGILLASGGKLVLNLGVSQQIYVYSNAGGETVVANWKAVG